MSDAPEFDERSAEVVGDAARAAGPGHRCGTDAPTDAVLVCTQDPLRAAGRVRRRGSQCQSVGESHRAVARSTFRRGADRHGWVQRRSSASSPDGTTATGTTTASGAGASPLHFVAFGDSWPEGAHCNGCTTFAGLWADDLEELTGTAVVFTDLTGEREGSAAESKTSASLLQSLTTNDRTRDAVRAADIVLVATGPNEMEQAHQALLAGTCGGPDQFDCIRALGVQWSETFDAIVTEIRTLRAGQPTAIRLVNAANPFLSAPEMNEGLPDGFAASGGHLIFQLLTAATCDAAAAHDAVCVDVRPLLNGPNLDQRVDENSSASMRAIADALNATALPELD